MSVGEGEDAQTAWVTAQVTSVLVDGQFQARIELPGDAWDDWFSWGDEDVEWRRIPEPEPEPEPPPDPNAPWGRHLAARAAEPPPERHADPPALFATLQSRIAEMRTSPHDLDDEIDGWYIKYKLRKKGHSGPRAGDILVVDPVDGKSFASMVGVRRRLGLSEHSGHASPGANGRGGNYFKPNPNPNPNPNAHSHPKR